MRKIIVGAWGLFFRAGEKAPLMLTGDQDPPERRHRRDLSTRGNLIARAQAEASKRAAPAVTANVAFAIPAQVNPMTKGERHLQMGEAHV